jgi:exo-beta-1,3-glucanase (GH17 family)/cellulose synthase/poly-beta-1,6-N-acetylglucosamine synthase-like glycosyltransferase
LATARQLKRYLLTLFVTVLCANRDRHYNAAPTYNAATTATVSKPCVFMKISSVVVMAVFALLTFGLWAQLNKHTNIDPWPEGRFGGFSFQPFRADQDATKDEWPTVQQIDEDLALVATRAINIRTYSSRGTLAEVPRLALKHHLQVTVGAYLYADKDKQNLNAQEIDGMLKLANNNKNVIRAIVGNETLYREEMSVAQLSELLDSVRPRTRKPVSTAEPWHIWMQHPELADHVDYLAVHFLPYWESMSVEDALKHIVIQMQNLQKKFPKKRIIITEVGWPSSGRTREHAVASLANEAFFLREFVKLAQANGYTYYICEAFDQPWKEKTQEGGAGAYWGVWDADRQPKFPLDTAVSDVGNKHQLAIERLPDWDVLATISVVIAGILLAAFYLYSHTLQTRGRTFLAFVVYATAIVTVWIIYDYSRSYLSMSLVLIGALLVLGMLGVIAVILAEAHEWAEAHWVTSHKRVLQPASVASNYFPKVSLHVPAYNEPPDMLIETLDALAKLDYPDYEVLVIDNNTKDESVWRPVEAHCQKLGAKFRFFHVAPLAGFKAGALNFALRHTDSQAEVIAVIDSDYKVESAWLKDLVPAFVDPNIAIVQAPQDYRDGGDNAFKAMCYAEYRGFFHIGMITRNERNAIIQHGTMTIVRRSVLEKLGGWAEWCITEDAELGLRIFESGYEATYLPTSYGRGVMPDTFIDFKKQRFRWAYGAMQILRRHASSLLANKGNSLKPGQRYHFIAGWLPWIADGFNLLFTFGALVWSLLMWISTLKTPWFEFSVEPPLLTFSILPLMLFTFKLVKLLHLYVTRVGANLRQTVAAAAAGLALSHTIGMATLKGLVTRNEPFFRTPKLAKPHGFSAAFAAARTETILMLLLWLAAFSVSKGLTSPDRVMWTIMLLIQSLPYLATLLVSLASAFPLPARWLGKALGMTQTQAGVF